MVEPYLGKSRECLIGAQSEFANGRFNNAASRAYYAAYNAAIAALLRAGFTSRNNQWGHDEVMARFSGDLISRRKLYPAAFRRMLYDLSKARITADYGLALANREIARSAFETSRIFVNRILTRAR